MGSILIFSELDGLAFELLRAAREISGIMGLEVAAAVWGKGDPKEYGERGAARVFTSAHDLLKNFEPSVYAEALAQTAAAADASVILIGSTRRGKELAGRLAQKLNAGCLTDVKSLDFKDGRLTGVRNSFGGAAEAVQTVATGVQVIAILPRAFEPAAAVEGTGAVTNLDLDLAPSRLKRVRRSEKDPGAADIAAAEVLVCVGKGLAKPEDLKLVEDLACGFGRGGCLHEAGGHRLEMASRKQDRRTLRENRGSPGWPCASESRGRSSSPSGSARPRPLWR